MRNNPLSLLKALPDSTPPAFETATVLAVGNGSVDVRMADGTVYRGIALSGSATVGGTINVQFSGGKPQAFGFGGSGGGAGGLVVSGGGSTVTGSIVAGAGLTGGGTLGAGAVTIDAGAGDGISVSSSAIAVDSSVVRTSRTITAGDGLTGGGALSGDVTINAVVANTGATGLTIEANAIRLTSSSNPGAAASILASDASGYLALTKLRTPLIDTASGALVLTPSTGVTLTDGKTFNGSGGFTSGFAGAGWRLDQGVSYASQSTLEVDNVVVRGLMRVYELVINKIRVSRGSIIISPGGGKVSAVSGSGPYTLTFDDDHGLAENDLLRAQKFTGSGTYQSLLTVTGVPTSSTATVTVSSGSAPALGYEYAVVGSTSDTTRQGGLFLTADDSGAPFMDIYDGVAAHSDFNTNSKTKVRLGKLTGITDPFFGTLSGYGLHTSRAYLNGAYINGSLVIGPGVGFSTTAMLYLPFDTPPSSSAATAVNTNGHFGQRAAITGTVGGWGGLYGGCVDLTTDGSYLSYGADNNIHSTSTISAWVYIPTAPTGAQNAFIMSCGDVWAKGVNLWVSGSDGKLYFSLGNSGGSNTTINSTATFPTSAWTHVAATFVTGTSMYLYVNGALVASTTSSVVAPYLLSSNSIVVGGNPILGGTHSLRGFVDDFALIKRQLSADEVTAIYRSNTPLNVTRSGHELILADPSTAAKVVANAYGIFGTDNSAKPTFNLINVASTVNSESLTSGDVLMGDNSTSKANVLFDQSAGRLLFRGGTTTQAYVDTTGTIVAGGGNVRINVDGLELDQGTGDGNKIKFYNSTNLVGQIYSEQVDVINTFTIDALDSGGVSTDNILLSANTVVTSSDLEITGSITTGARVPRSSGAALFAVDASGTGSAITLADNATSQPFGAAANFSGLLIVNEANANGVIGIFACGAATTVLISESLAGYYSATSGTASRCNVYYNGSNYLTIENKQGGSRTFSVVAIRTRNSA
jgi:hypothetical protein